jgi:hypothetical protein
MLLWLIYTVKHTNVPFILWIFIKARTWTACILWVLANRHLVNDLIQFTTFCYSSSKIKSRQTVMLLQPPIHVLRQGFPQRCAYRAVNVDARR